MTSPRRKSIKWRKWKRKNPEKADSAQMRKIMRLVSTGSCFTRKAKRRYERAFATISDNTNPFVLVMPYGEVAEGFRYAPFGDDDGYQIGGAQEEK